MHIMKYDIVLLKKKGINGLTKTECMDLFGMLKEEEAYPVEIAGLQSECSAMGFIGKNADKKLEHEHDGLKQYVRNVLDKMNSLPYIAGRYNPDYGDDRICVCGHSYARHFDSYDNMEPVGCKHCGCQAFQEDEYADVCHSYLFEGLNIYLSR